MLVIVAKTQTFFSHIHRNLKLTTVWGHNSEKTLSSCTWRPGWEAHAQSCQSHSGWMGAIGNRSATLSLDFKKRVPNGIWRQYTRQIPGRRSSPPCWRGRGEKALKSGQDDKIFNFCRRQHSLISSSTPGHTNLGPHSCP